ncbi:HAMP domain-containing sensor histidine kinase [Streptomyces sp. DSM 44915]|uniref:histidine kinase n=1 Tax=Streptomyces chisholmiae TaxID=3075540 RepID=A0ABU2JVA6_9ACTN|nr:HAMP domain-containing sensor histidine kinase [Streptomyces sp. DSM 44915]MDT0268163.1 HAMP domain-containing sensor histidine kinase [Streptomyces sp. DSM 44915]
MIRRRWSRLPFVTRLALAFGGLFLASGTALLAFVVALARYGTAARAEGIAVSTDDEPLDGDAGPLSPTDFEPTERAEPTEWAGPTGRNGESGESAPTGEELPDGVSLRYLDATVQAVQDTAVAQMLLWSAIGLALMTVLVVLTGRRLARRALRPVTAVTDTALRISETSLDRRLDLSGPDDELHHLADAFDSMLERLQRAFDSQRRFVANASHELRTPLAAQRASIEVGLADPLPADLVETREDLLTTNREAERLIAALLLLARGERGLERPEEVDLAEAADTATEALRPLAEERGLALRVQCAEPARVFGDPVLIRHLITNLVGNALRYNRPDGHVEVTLDGGTLTVTNTGAPIAPELVEGLFEPFRRLGQDRVGGTGHGLGLSIVRSIARAHGAALRAAPGPDGGLAVTVEFRAARAVPVG